MPAVEDQARAAVADALEMLVAEVPDDASIDTFPAWDSLAHIRVITRLEQILDRPLEPEEIFSITDLASVAALLGSAGATA